MKVHELSSLLIRFYIFYLGFSALIDISANIIDTYQDFDPNYLSYYLSSQCLYPAMKIIGAFVLYLCQKPLIRFISKPIKGPQ